MCLGRLDVMRLSRSTYCTSWSSELLNGINKKDPSPAVEPDCVILSNSHLAASLLNSVDSPNTPHKILSKFVFRPIIMPSGTENAKQKFAEAVDKTKNSVGGTSHTC